MPVQKTNEFMEILSLTNGQAAGFYLEKEDSLLITSR